MNQERWKQIDRLFDEILELSEEERKDFIEKNCSQDEDLRQDLLSLLQAHAKTENFIEGSALKIVTKQLGRNYDFEQKDSLIGQNIDSYTIENLIGEGGMGEVYLANDKKLKRKVALKILPPHYTKNIERVHRLTREARAISTLNHPNIVTIYDVGKFEQINYIATEFVEGKTLRKLLPENPPLREVLDIFIQCCDALSAAHQAGIIHRDVKPENIIVRPDGYVKVLDFGLAKLTEKKQNDTLDLAVTMKGAIMGTPSYMSPEQVSGVKVDKRTDLWSLGVVFYEMLTGVNPFKRKDRKTTFQAILTEEPERASLFNEEIPSELDTILIKVLEKDSNLSYQNASEIRIDLMRIKREIDSSPDILNTGIVSQSFWKKKPWFIKLSLILAPFLFFSVVSFFWYFYFSQQNRSNPFDWTRAKNVPLTTQAGTEYYPNLSPDGKIIYFLCSEGRKF